MFYQLLTIIILVVGCLAGGAFLWEKANTDPRFLMQGDTLAMAGAIRECPEAVTELEEIGRSFINRSLLDPVILSDLDSAYGKSPWIRRITHIRRHFPNRIELELLLRLPVAQVKQGREYWLIDSEGYILSATGSTSPFPALPEISEAVRGTIQGRPKQQGTEWKDEGLQGALGVMRAFWASPLAQAFPIAKVVVVGGAYRDNQGNNQSSIRRYEVLSTTGALVRWGSFNAEGLPGELTSGEKLWNLQELLQHDGADLPGVALDVRTHLPGYSQY
jgi:hypothetical protein